ncbi:LLM class flavin-dependent oxidoreductase [Nocardia sp. SYP-A9097]|nr:LLM class flavin-dependent oxidoreductase [Nocardia sp. SYP-A9097]
MRTESSGDVGGRMIKPAFRPRDSARMAARADCETVMVNSGLVRAPLRTAGGSSEPPVEPRAATVSSGAAQVAAPSYTRAVPDQLEFDTAAAGFELVVAAFGERALAAAARTADRVVLNLVTPAQVARCVTAVRRYAAAANRPAPAVSVWVTAAADPTPEMLLTLRRGMVGYLRAPGYDAMFAEAGFGDAVRLAYSGAHPRDVLAAVSDELPAAVGMFGDAATLADRLAAYRVAGADEVVIVPVTAAADPAGLQTLETIARIGRE